ncbi:MAG: hypothetical protein WCO16_00825 [bacterium]
MKFNGNGIEGGGGLLIADSNENEGELLAEVPAEENLPVEERKDAPEVVSKKKKTRREKKAAVVADVKEEEAPEFIPDPKAVQEAQEGESPRAKVILALSDMGEALQNVAPSLFSVSNIFKAYKDLDLKPIDESFKPNTISEIIRTIDDYADNPTKENFEKIQDPIGLGLVEKVLEILPIGGRRMDTHDNNPIPTSLVEVTPVARIPQSPDVSKNEVVKKQSKNRENKNHKEGELNEKKPKARKVYHLDDEQKKHVKKEGDQEDLVGMDKAFATALENYQPSELGDAIKKARENQPATVEKTDKKPISPERERRINPDTVSQGKTLDALRDALKQARFARDESVIRDLINNKFIARAQFADQYKGFQNIVRREVVNKGYGDIFLFTPTEEATLQRVIAWAGLRPREVTKPKEKVVERKEGHSKIDQDAVSQTQILESLIDVSTDKDYEKEKSVIDALIVKYKIRKRFADDARGYKNIDFKALEAKGYGKNFELTKEESKVVDGLINKFKLRPLDEPKKEEKRPERRDEKRQEPKHTNQTGGPKKASEPVKTAPEIQYDPEADLSRDPKLSPLRRFMNMFLKREGNKKPPQTFGKQEKNEATREDLERDESEDTDY